MVKETPFWLKFIPYNTRLKIAERTNLLAIINNSGWLLFDKLVRMGLGLLIGAWVARYLGPEQYGELNYVLAYITFFQAIALLGIDGIVVRDIARDKEQTGQILGTAFMLRVISGIACWFASVGGMILINGWHDRSVLITALASGCLIFQAVDIIDLWFQSQSQSKRTVTAKFIAYLLSNGIKVVLIILQAPLIAFAVVIALDAFTAAVGLIVAYSYFPCSQQWQRVAQQGKNLLKESWPFMAAGIINLFQARIEFFIIETMLGVEQLGQYVASLKFMEIFDIAGTILAVSIFPKLASYSSENASMAIRKTYFFMLLIYLFNLPCMIFVWIMMGFVYGPQYAIAQDIFFFMALRPLFTYLGVTRSMAIKIDGKTWYSPFCSTIGAFIAASTAYVFIPYFGLLGAVASATISYMCSNLLIDILFYRKNFHNLIRCYK